ncbi:MAG: Gx transporter family protein [Clostridia bacterium]|nr:Gx transporter family protein [Clostridia bacterium]
MNTKKITMYGLFTAHAMIMSLIEILKPIPLPGTGIKVGCPNIIILFVLYRFGAKTAIAVSLVRVLLVSLLFGNFLGLAYSLAGAVLSLVVMILLKATDMFSTLGVSVVGGIFHNVGQIIVACVLMSTSEISYYMPVLIITGTAAGIVVGIASHLLIKKTEKLKLE